MSSLALWSRTSSLNASLPNCGLCGSVEQCCQVVGPPLQWLWPWHCASLTLPDLWAQWLLSQPSSTSPHCQQVEGGGQCVMEGREGGQGEKQGKEGKYACACLCAHAQWVNRVCWLQFYCFCYKMHITQTLMLQKLNKILSSLLDNSTFM